MSPYGAKYHSNPLNEKGARAQDLAKHYSYSKRQAQQTPLQLTAALSALKPIADDLQVRSIGTRASIDT